MSRGLCGNLVLMRIRIQARRAASKENSTRQIIISLCLISVPSVRRFMMSRNVRLYAR